MILSKFNYIKNYIVKEYKLNNNLISLCTSPFRSNAYILSNNKNECKIIYLLGILIDPGYDYKEILKFINTQKLLFILCTHGHIDHIGAVGNIQRKLNVPCYINSKDKFYLKSLITYKNFINMNDSTSFLNYNDINENTKLKFGNDDIKTIFTPGHSPGSCCFHINNYLFTGDTLFKNEIGRTDIYNAEYL